MELGQVPGGTGYLSTKPSSAGHRHHLMTLRLSPRLKSGASYSKYGRLIGSAASINVSDKPQVWSLKEYSVCLIKLS